MFALYNLNLESFRKTRPKIGALLFLRVHGVQSGARAKFPRVADRKLGAGLLDRR